MTSPFFTHLECTRTGARYDREKLHNLSEVGAPLFARYNLAGVALSVSPQDLSRRTAQGMWRYREIMPLRPGDTPVTLDEGSTPLRSAPRLAAALELSRLWIKDESTNPTGSFKARGLSAAVTAAAARGARKLAIPTAGNAGGALAAYAAAAGLECHVFMPRHHMMTWHDDVAGLSYGPSRDLMRSMMRRGRFPNMKSRPSGGTVALLLTLLILSRKNRWLGNYSSVKSALGGSLINMVPRFFRFNNSWDIRFPRQKPL